MRTAYVNGRRMTARQISDYVFETRGYRIDRNTIAKRMRRGLSGDLLLTKPGKRGPKKTPKPKAVKTQPKVWPQKLVRVSVPGWGVRV